MAYPYMNGSLHAGHCFTLSKVEYAVGFERMNGKRALFPLGFHCTGMPIRASADKIAREIEKFGPDFSNLPTEEEEQQEASKRIADNNNNAKNNDPTKFKAQKSKVVAKKGKGKYQFQIMNQIGIPIGEIKKFADPTYWLYYFPQLCQNDVISFGARVDWRRSMITTDVNPYYDSFIRWQITRLRECGKIKFGERYTIFSEKDGQACLDHDRQSGEGLGPQEYTGIKIKILELFNQDAKDLFNQHSLDLNQKNVYLVAATLRPETMYGQTCCFVSPKINYGVFDAGNNNYYITTIRAFKNMCYQKLTPQRGNYKPIFTISGQSLIGSKITAPLAINKQLYILPMETILEKKGTGIVTCVPTDSPDDYINMKDLKNKPEYYNIKKEWASPELIPLINTPKYGDKCAEYLCNFFKIQSPKDSVQLQKAKELAYKEGFFNGTMIIGKYAGEKVEFVKAKVKNDIVESGEGFVYYEPEGVVMSRSGDECIVSKEDQWFIDYGESEWKSQALECLHSMNTFAPETQNAFEGVLDWLKNWAVTRTYGLGTRLPWDEQYLIESLSDSTIYQAFYTICHLLHSDYYGSTPGLLNIKAEDMSFEVWDYIFTRRESIESNIPLDKLKILRREFEYFYPLDSSISGKDLIPNHLTFFIYTHVALFKNKKFWPAGIRANGHLLLNNEKMSKSTGNFFTLKDLVEKFGADATRICLADAGDGIEDANFVEQNANSAILRLFNLKEWCQEVVSNIDSLRSGPIGEEFFDVAFDNEMNSLIEETYKKYEITEYKSALKSGLFDYQSARDYYREVAAPKGLHKDLVLKYIETQILLITPVAPHIAEFIWKEVLLKEGSVHDAKFPRADKPIDNSISDSLNYLRDLSRSIREAETSSLRAKKGKILVDKNKGCEVTLLISNNFPEWQDKYVEIVRELFEEQSLNDNKKIKEKIPGKEMKKAMPFISLLKQRLIKEEPSHVFNRKLSFNEAEVIKKCIDIVERSPAIIKVEKVEVISFNTGENKGINIFTNEEVPFKYSGKVVESTVPGQPGIIIKNI
ncbi:leucine--tRNA ligase CDC60 [Ascoidea rubescens DSM 1968]|uniref:leucine--tRNA ligase n=1 Tax=Ascoidea rubescens DSM 1968 TaxID=1344418 RepID=A0A1D2VE80_9ASCO|nr:leucyl-tRNA synthetase [Ascoidea rubescens DSM 1968]ODV59803.1 leucyl-tRNA synthetase [Ascoidea rubescens DSM 1968]